MRHRALGKIESRQMEGHKIPSSSGWLQRGDRSLAMLVDYITTIAPIPIAKEPREVWNSRRISNMQRRRAFGTVFAFLHSVFIRLGLLIEPTRLSSEAHTRGGVPAKICIPARESSRSSRNALQPMPSPRVSFFWPAYSAIAR